MTRQGNYGEADETQPETRKDSLIQNFPRAHGASSVSTRHLSSNRPFLSTLELNLSRQGVSICEQTFKGLFKFRAIPLFHNKIWLNTLQKQACRN